MSSTPPPVPPGAPSNPPAPSSPAPFGGWTPPAPAAAPPPPPPPQHHAAPPQYHGYAQAHHAQPPAPPEVSWGEAWKGTDASPLHVQSKKAWVHGVLAIVCAIPLGALGAIAGGVFAYLAWKRAKALRAQVDPHPTFHPRIKDQLKQAYVMSIVAAVLVVLQILALFSGGSGPAGAASGCVGNDANDAFVCWTD